MQVNSKPYQTQLASTRASNSIGISTSARERAVRHYQRAQEQIKLKHPKQALRELRDAIEIDPTTSEYHALLGKVHLDQGMVGMANICLREALKLNPKQPLALECMETLRARQAQPNQHQPSQPNLVNRVLGLLSKKL